MCGGVCTCQQAAVKLNFVIVTFLDKLDRTRLVWFGWKLGKTQWHL